MCIQFYHICSLWHNTFPTRTSAATAAESRPYLAEEQESCSRFQVPPHTVHVITQYETEIVVFFWCARALSQQNTHTHSFSFSYSPKSKLEPWSYRFIILFYLNEKKNQIKFFFVCFALQIVSLFCYFCLWTCSDLTKLMNFFFIQNLQLGTA